MTWISERPSNNYLKQLTHTDKKLSSYLDQQCNWLIDEDCRNEKFKDVLRKTRKVFDQETSLQGYHAKQDDHYPETDPTAPGKELHIVCFAKLI